jgi:sRNA-binding regulator protein Hfq
MKKVLLFVFSVFQLVKGSAQSADKAYLHNGKVLEVKVTKVGEFTVTYKYVGEDAEQTVGKYAVKKIVYGSSGREEEISEKITVAGKEEWERVLLIEDKAAVVGLSKKGEIRGKTSGVFGFHTANSADRKAIRKLKEEAAEMGAPFVLLTSEGDARSNRGAGMGTAQGVKRGLAYAYQ